MTHNFNKKITAALKMLHTTESGKKILSIAKKKWNMSNYENIAEIVKAGIESRTVHKKIRTIEDNSFYEMNTLSIQINQNHDLLATIFDLSHELIHAVYQKPFDCYASNTHLKDFLHYTYYGPGGELQALRFQCQILKELNAISFFRDCENILSVDELSLSSSTMSQKYFFKNQHFQSPIYITWIYQKIMEQACQNSIKIIKEFSEENISEKKKIQYFIQNKCSNKLNF